MYRTEDVSLLAGTVSALAEFGRCKLIPSGNNIGDGITVCLDCPRDNYYFTDEDDLRDKLKRGKEGINMFFTGITIKYKIVDGTWNKADGDMNVRAILNEILDILG